MHAKLSTYDIDAYLEDLHKSRCPQTTFSHQILVVEKGKLEAYISEIYAYKRNGTRSKKILQEKMGSYPHQNDDHEWFFDIIYPITISVEGIEASSNRVLNYIHTVEELEEIITASSLNLLCLEGFWYFGLMEILGFMVPLDIPKT